MFKNILVAVDDSPHAKAAVEYAAYLALLRLSHIPVLAHR